MIGNVYLLKGEPVQVLARAEWIKGTPRNVLILKADGSQTVRPFRGLRRLPSFAPSPDADKRSRMALTMADTGSAAWKEGRSGKAPGHESKLPAPPDPQETK